MVSEVDIVIVGAGAAGLAAARRLAGGELSLLVLEARDRVGGRAHTMMSDGVGLDLGCGWLHSAEDNLFSPLAEPLGFTLDKRPPHWTRQASNRPFSADDQHAFRTDLAALEARMSAAAQRGEDRRASDFFDPASRWTPLIDAFSSFYNGDAFDQISTVDFEAYEDGEVNWRVLEGYGALIAAFGARAPVQLNTPVTRIDHHGARVRVETPAGALSARAVIVTLPTPLLAREAIVFDPPLPAVAEAAEGLPLGLANKVFLALDRPEDFEADSHLFGDPARTETGSYALRPLGRPMIEAFLGGRCARTLEQAGDGAAAAFALDELCSLLGSDFRARARPIVETRWAADPWSLGAYSHALPGRAGARAVLRQVFAGRIAFAGEACSAHAFSTAHGAAESGIAAADKIAALLTGQALAEP